MEDKQFDTDNGDTPTPPVFSESLYVSDCCLSSNQIPLSDVSKQCMTFAHGTSGSSIASASKATHPLAGLCAAKRADSQTRTKRDPTLVVAIQTAWNKYCWKWKYLLLVLVLGAYGAITTLVTSGSASLPGWSRPPIREQETQASMLDVLRCHPDDWTTEEDPTILTPPQSLAWDWLLLNDTKNSRLMRNDQCF